jgi:hypothetical protein
VSEAKPGPCPACGKALEVETLGGRPCVACLTPDGCAWFLWLETWNAIRARVLREAWGHVLHHIGRLPLDDHHRPGAQYAVALLSEAADRAERGE